MTTERSKRMSSGLGAGRSSTPRRPRGFANASSDTTWNTSPRWGTGPKGWNSFSVSSFASPAYAESAGRASTRTVSVTSEKTAVRASPSSAPASGGSLTSSQGRLSPLAGSGAHAPATVSTTALDFGTADVACRGPWAVECHQRAPSSSAGAGPAKVTVTSWSSPRPDRSSSGLANRHLCGALRVASTGVLANGEKGEVRSVHSTAVSRTAPSASPNCTVGADGAYGGALDGERGRRAVAPLGAGSRPWRAPRSRPGPRWAAARGPGRTRRARRRGLRERAGCRARLAATGREAGRAGCPGVRPPRSGARPARGATPGRGGRWSRHLAQRGRRAAGARWSRRGRAPSSRARGSLSRASRASASRPSKSAVMAGPPGRRAAPGSPDGGAGRSGTPAARRSGRRRPRGRPRSARR